MTSDAEHTLGGTETTLGRRARKRAATRAAITDAALTLFLQHGFRAVSIKEIADRADVAVATVFAHFPTKEALLFDEEAGGPGSAAFEDSLLAAVTDRPREQGLLDALHAFLAGAPGLRETETDEFKAVVALAKNTPELRAAWRQTWTRHADALAAAIDDDAAGRGAAVPPVRAMILARLVLEAADLATTADRPRQTLAQAFTLLGAGWDTTEPYRQTSR